MKRSFWAVLLLIALLAKASCQDNEKSGSGSNPDKGGDKPSSDDDAAEDRKKDDSSSNKKSKKSKNGVSAMAFSGLLLFVSSMLFSLQ